MRSHSSASSSVRWRTETILKSMVCFALCSVVMLAPQLAAAQYDYIQNDNLNFGSTQIPSLTTGATNNQEWFGAVLTNDTDSDFTATEVHFIVAAIPDGVDRDLTCALFDLLDQPFERAERVGFRLKMWLLNEDDVLDLPSPTGTDAILTYPAGEDEVEATVDAITIVPLGVELTLQPGQGLVVAINFTPEYTNPCTGMLMQDDFYDVLAGTRNLLYGTLETLGDLGGCEDLTPRWRDFNAACSATPSGPGGSGDFAIRLARDAVDEGEDTGVADTGTPDTGPSDMGNDDSGTSDMGSDVPTAVELTISRVTPSMGPTNLDVNLSLTGTGLTDGVLIRVGPTELTGVSVSDSTAATGTLSAGLPTGSYDVIATLNGETATFPNGFLVTDAEYAAPSMRNIVPNSAPIGESVRVTITGQNFVDGTDVLFGGLSGFNTQVNADGTSLTVTSPSTLNVGTYNVEVSNPDGQSDTFFGGFQIVDLGSGSEEEGCSIASASSASGATAAWALVPFGLWLLRRRRR